FLLAKPRRSLLNRRRRCIATQHEADITAQPPGARRLDFHQNYAAAKAPRAERCLNGLADLFVGCLHGAILARTGPLLVHPLGDEHIRLALHAAVAVGAPYEVFAVGAEHRKAVELLVEG